MFLEWVLDGMYGMEPFSCKSNETNTLSGIRMPNFKSPCRDAMEEPGSWRKTLSWYAHVVCMDVYASVAQFSRCHRFVASMCWS